MKRRLYHIILGFFAISFWSCEEVIEIDLNSVNPALVVEGHLYEDSLALIKLSKTANYFSLDLPSPVEDAIVNLSSDRGEEESLAYLGGGYYSGQSIVGTSGTNYTLSIEWEGKEYSGSSYMFDNSEIVSLNIIPFQPAPQAPQMIQLETGFLDDGEEENFYFLRYTVNDTINRDIYLVFPDQAAVRDTIRFVNPTLVFDPGDVVKIELFSIDEPLFNFFNQLNSAVSGNIAISSTPYNPASNIEGAMGYFAAWSYTQKSIFITNPWQ